MVWVIEISGNEKWRKVIGIHDIDDNRAVSRLILKLLTWKTITNYENIFNNEEKIHSNLG
jgi:hypothetical protein